MKKQKNNATIRRFTSYYKPHIRLFVIDMICAFIISVFNLVYPYITKEIINNYVPNKILTIFLTMCGMLIAFYAIKALLNFVVQYWGHIVGIRIQADMRKELFEHLQKMPFTYFDNNKTGVIMSRMTNDLFEIAELAHHGPEDVFLSVITMLGAFIVLLTIQPLLALIVFIFIPGIAVFTILMRRRMKKVFADMRIVQGEINADIESAVSGIRISRAYNAKQHEINKFEKRNVEFVQARARQYKVMGQFFSSMYFLMDFLYFAVLLAGGLFLFYDVINVGEFAAFILYVTTLITPIRTLTNIFEQIQNGATGFKRFCDIVDEPLEIEREDAITTKLNGNIKFEEVTFGYQSEENKKTVIQDFSLTIPQGKTVALIGPSGGGKTTLCHLIPRFYEIDSGKITIDNIDIKDLTLDCLRSHIALVQQDVFLFNGTIKENIMYGNFEATMDEIIQAAKRANIHEHIMSLPNGYDTQVGERGIKLSGGQKQRISIARAFLKNPPILILDEATSALDNATEMMIQQSLSELSKGRTTIVVAHRLSTIKNADEIVVITPEGIEERGNHEQLIAQNGVYKQLYEYQFKNL